MIDHNEEGVGGLVPDNWKNSFFGLSFNYFIFLCKFFFGKVYSSFTLFLILDQVNFRCIFRLAIPLSWQDILKGSRYRHTNIPLEETFGKSHFPFVFKISYLYNKFQHIFFGFGFGGGEVEHKYYINIVFHLKV